MAQVPSSGPRGVVGQPLVDGHLAALLRGADPDLLAVVSILALSGMRLDELRCLRVAQCGRGSFRIAECAANLGPREVPVHSALVGSVLHLTGRRAGDAFLIGDGAGFGRAPSRTERRFDACRALVGAAGPLLGIHGLRRWSVRAALDAEQPPDAIAAVIGHLVADDARPKPTWASAAPAWRPSDCRRRHRSGRPPRRRGAMPVALRRFPGLSRFPGPDDFRLVLAPTVPSAPAGPLSGRRRAAATRG